MRDFNPETVTELVNAERRRAPAAFFLPLALPSGSRAIASAGYTFPRLNGSLEHLVLGTRMEGVLPCVALSHTPRSPSGRS
jgi:hypothetical protein